MQLFILPCSIMTMCLKFFVFQDYKDFTPPEVYIKHTSWEDVCMWEPSHTKVQVCYMHRSMQVLISNCLLMLF